MATEEQRAPQSTEVSSPETEVDPQASGPYDSAAAAAQSESPDERLAIGQRLSRRYRIERELGEGGMGVVYLVSDQQVAGEIFAIKVLKGSLGPEALELLREEVRRTRKLSHPNIVDVHSVNVDGRRLYVLMEYLEGKSLDVLLAEEFGRGMPFSHAWPIIEDIGAALGNAHDHNVIHSDLKPANVFVTTSGRTKLLDFGIARISRSPLLHTRSGPRALTPEYASCEMLEGKEADARDDIYSFACVIYEMLCGKRPFGELTALEAREARAQVPLLVVLSRGQNAALAQALAFERQGRTGSVEELLSGLADKKPRGRQTAVLGVIAAVAALGLTYFALEKLLISRQSVVVQSSAPLPAATPVAFNPPPHSIAVLPFVNMSGDKEQEYFSDGLTEEILNSLTRIDELQVSARTSSFYFKGEHTDLSTIAHKLNVASVLEGSVRRAGQTIRVTAQLNNAVTGFHLWSQTYDRNLTDVLAIQTEIASAVASALKVAILGDTAAKIALGGTRNPAALDAYLRASQYRKGHNGEDVQAAIEAYSEAIRLDPDYAMAFAARSIALADFAWHYAPGTVVTDSTAKALADANEAIAQAPDLADGHLALAIALAVGSLEFQRAGEEYERALTIAPGNARVLMNYGNYQALMGRVEPGIDAGTRAIVLDPLSSNARDWLAYQLFLARRYSKAIAACQDSIAINPRNPFCPGIRGLAYYALVDFQNALSSCEPTADTEASRVCLAITYDKLGRRADADSMVVKLRASRGDAAAYRFAEIYAQRGNVTEALEWLSTGMRLRSPWMEFLKTDPLLDPLRKEPRFQAIERELKFPN